MTASADPEPLPGVDPRAPRLRSLITLGIALYALILVSGLALLTTLFAELPLHELGTLMLIATAEAIAIAALAGSMLSRRIAQPMEAWAAVAERIIRAERDVSFPRVRGTAELERLGATLQAMFENLVRRESTLQAGIAERTEALTHAVVELQGERDRLADALQGSRLVIWEMDVITGAVRLSIEWSRLMGAAEGETVTTLEQLRALVPEEEQPALEQAIFAALKGDVETYDVDHRVRRPDASFLWIRSRGRVTRRDARGWALTMVGTNSEIESRKAAEAAARESERRLRLVIDNIPVMVGLLDRGFRFVFANRRYLEFFGLERGAVIGHTLAEVAGPEAQAISERHRRELEAGTASVEYERERRDARGVLRHLEVRLVPHVDARGELIGHFSLVDDVTERRAAARALAESAAELKLVTDGVATLIARFDLEGHILFANRRYFEFFDVDPAWATGRRIAEVVGRDAEEKYLAHVAALRRGEEATYQREAELRGQRYYLEVHLVPHRAGGAVDGAYVLVTDITSRKLLEQVLEQEALTDPLTGLPNKRHFGERLAQAIAHARRQSSHVALLFLDLDGFKEVNDRLGHAAGDKLLREVATRLLACVRAADTVARLGGDEFAVLMESNRSSDAAEFVAGKVIAALNDPFPMAEGEAVVTCSVGIALHPVDGEDAETLLRHADRAMYRAKQAGKNRFARWAA